MLFFFAPSDIIGRMIKKMTLEKLARMIRDGFADVDFKIIGITEQISGFTERIDGLAADHRSLEENFVGLKDYMDYRFDMADLKMEKKFEGVSREFELVHDEIRVIHRILDRESVRTDTLEKRVDVLENNPKPSVRPA